MTDRSKEKNMTENARISLNVGPMLLFTSPSTTMWKTLSVARGDRSLHTHQVLRVSMETDMFTCSIKCCMNSVEDSGSFTSVCLCVLCSAVSVRGNRGYMMVSNDGTV